MAVANVDASNNLRSTFELRSKNDSCLVDKLNRARIKRILNDDFETPWFKAMVKIVYSSRLILKLVLLVFVIASTGYASYLTIESINAYLAFKVATTTRAYYEAPTLFPKVTLCNLNKNATEYAYHLLHANDSKDWSDSDQERKKLGHRLEDILMEC